MRRVELHTNQLARVLGLVRNSTEEGSAGVGILDVRGRFVKPHAKGGRLGLALIPQILSEGRTDVCDAAASNSEGRKTEDAVIEFRLGDRTVTVKLSHLNVVGQTDLLIYKSRVFRITKADGIVDVVVARDKFAIASV